MIEEHHPDLVSVKEAAILIGVSYTTMLKACQSGEISAVSFGGRWIINKKKLLEKFGIYGD